MNYIEGNLIAQGLKIGIAAARFARADGAGRGEGCARDFA